MQPSAISAERRPSKPHSRASIIDSILRWNELYGEPPVTADWNPSLARWRAQEWRIPRYRAGDPETGRAWPSVNAAKRRFGGSFDAAIRAAGLEPRRPGPPRAAGEARPDIAPRSAPASLPLAPARDGDADGVEHAAGASSDASVAGARAAAPVVGLRKRSGGQAQRARVTGDEPNARLGEVAPLPAAGGVRQDGNGRLRLTPAALHALRGDGPGGPGPLAAALKDLARARSSGDRQRLQSALTVVAAAAVAWRDRL